MTVDIRYRELFQVDIRHAYYDGGICRGLTLAPTPECSALMARYRCRFQPATGGGAVWYGAEDGQAGIADFVETGPFAFTLTAIDRDLSTITALDPRSPDPASTIFYFDNMTAIEGEFMGERGLMLRPAGGTVLALRGRAFRHAFEAPLSGKELNLLSVPDGRVVWQGSGPPQPAPALDLDLGSVADGRYLLQLDKRTLLDFYLSDQPAAELFGIVEIFPGGPSPAPKVPPKARLIDAKGAIASKAFTLPLEGRRSIWRYIVVSRAQGRDYGAATVAGGNSTGPFEPDIPFSFAGPEEAGGRPAWVFESQDPIPLLEAPARQHRFMLSAPDDGGAPADQIRLPYAAPSGTRLQRKGGKTRFCSDIYVYL